MLPTSYFQLKLHIATAPSGNCVGLNNCPRRVLSSVCSLVFFCQFLASVFLCVSRSALFCVLMGSVSLHFVYVGCCMFFCPACSCQAPICSLWLSSCENMASYLQPSTYTHHGRFRFGRLSSYGPFPRNIGSHSGQHVVQSCNVLDSHVTAEDDTVGLGSPWEIIGYLIITLSDYTPVIKILNLDSMAD